MISCQKLFQKPVESLLKNCVLSRSLLINLYLNRFYSNKNMAAKKACVFLANGAEEMEFVVATDVLRRAGIKVTVAGVPDCQPKKCSRDVTIVPDCSVEDVKSMGDFDIFILPGGLGGAKALAESKTVGSLLTKQDKNKKYIGAICAAPTALKAHSVGVGKNVTSYPAMKSAMLEGGNYKYTDEKVVVDGNIITSRGPGTSFDFALKIVETLLDKNVAVKTAEPMLVEISC